MAGPDTLPEDLPAPVDDGAADHLRGAKLPRIALAATDGSSVSLALLPGRLVVYVYPRTGEPGKSPAAEWDAIPGARGCTPQSCSFRDHFAELQELGVSRVFGLSTQDTAYQREAVERLHLPFPLLSDERLDFTRAAGLPTFTFGGMTLIRRMAFVIDAGRVTRLFYPVCPPDRSAGDVVAWLRSNRV
jgi:peroxiredoxin (alkyl hydroperoxide reductase subunit C)